MVAVCDVDGEGGATVILNEVERWSVHQRVGDRDAILPMVVVRIVRWMQ